jgi:GxxExxY protein
MKKWEFTRPMPINHLTEIVIGLCIEIHSKIGPGCYERVYEEALYYELIRHGLNVRRQLLLPIKYKELNIRDAYKLDLLIEEKLIVELKSKHPLHPIDFCQLHTYLSLNNLKHGLLANFKVAKMKDGIHRVFNNFGKE